MFIFTTMEDLNSYRILQDGIFLIENFDIGGNDLLTKLKSEVKWDTNIKSRKTASFGVPYNYSNINYEFYNFPSYISEIIDKIEIILNYRPNNCLINYYNESFSRMGYHSDQIEILEPNTGILILSLGSSRTMRFKNKNENNLFDVIINSDSLLYMTQETQNKWLHSILPEQGPKSENERISITFRKIKLDI